MDEKGVYAVARAIWDDPDFADAEYSQREAWMWLIGAAAWKEIRIRGNGGSITLKRGEFAFSIRFLAERFGWSKSRVERFISALKNRDTIRDVSRDGSTVYSIKNYNDFQVVGLKKRDTNRDTIRDASGTAAGHERDKEETLETLNIKTEEEGAPVGAASSPKPKIVTAEVIYPVWLPMEPWGAFVNFRRCKDRKAWTPDAERLCLKKLEQLANQGHDPTAVLEQSIMRNWTGLFPIKAENDNGSKSNPPRATSTDQHMAGIAALAGDLRRQRGTGGH